MPRITAFLQNMWVRDPDRVRAGIARYGEAYRQRATYQFLFAGCTTGRRLKTAFGDLIGQITWEESTPEIADNPRTIFPADPAWITKILQAQQPIAVLTFGRIATAAVTPLWSGPLITAPHPAARQSDVPLKLANAARQLREILIPKS